jgi:hypothetical protein
MHIPVGVHGILILFTCYKTNEPFMDLKVCSGSDGSHISLFEHFFPFVLTGADLCGVERNAYE